MRTFHRPVETHAGIGQLCRAGFAQAGGKVAAALVATQLIFSALIDRLGLLDVTQIGLTPARVLGIALLIAGTVLVTSR